jgi:hypothetical protein
LLIALIYLANMSEDSSRKGGSSAKKDEHSFVADQLNWEQVRYIY